jgi:hypothetical protein
MRSSNPSVPPYAPFESFHLPSVVLPVGALGLAGAAVALWAGAGRRVRSERRSRRAVALILGGVSIALLERWRRRAERAARPPVTQAVVPRTPADRPMGPPRRNVEERLDEAVEETFPASDPIAVHIE